MSASKSWLSIFLIAKQCYILQSRIKKKCMYIKNETKKSRKQQVPKRMRHVFYGVSRVLWCVPCFMVCPVFYKPCDSSRIIKHVSRNFLNIICALICMGTTVPQWLRCCATNQKVASLIPDGVIEMLH